MATPASLVRQYVLYIILPLWLLVGLIDYFLHKQTRIEENAGIKESLLHVLQLGEAGIPVVLGLLLDINALVILLMLIALVLHEITALWDVSYAHTKRYIGPFEQHIHSFMEVLPIMAVSFITILYWDQFLTLLGMSTQADAFEFRVKPDPLPIGYLIAIFISIVLFIVIPYAEEFWRCLKAARNRVSTTKVSIARAA